MAGTYVISYYIITIVHIYVELKHFYNFSYYITGCLRFFHGYFIWPHICGLSIKKCTDLMLFPCTKCFSFARYPIPTACDDYNFAVIK
jgi:hypothetical protein